jgi:hypothetical protein
MMYRNNNKAWMTITLFQEWLKEFDYQVARKHRGQHVLLFLDNCTVASESIARLLTNEVIVI